LFFWPQLIAENDFVLHRSAEGRRERRLSSAHQKNPRSNQLDGGPRFEYATSSRAAPASPFAILEPVDLVDRDIPDTDRRGGSDSGVKALRRGHRRIKVFVERNSYFMLGAGIRTTNGFEAADQRAIVGFIFRALSSTTRGMRVQ